MTLKPCKEWQERNPKTNRCRAKTKSLLQKSKSPSQKSKSPSQKKRCQKGTRRNKKTGRCESTAKSKSPSQKSKSKSTSILKAVINMVSSPAKVATTKKKGRKAMTDEEKRAFAAKMADAKAAKKGVKVPSKASSSHQIKSSSHQIKSSSHEAQPLVVSVHELNVLNNEEIRPSKQAITVPSAKASSSSKTPKYLRSKNGIYKVNRYSKSASYVDMFEPGKKGHYSVNKKVHKPRRLAHGGPEMYASYDTWVPTKRKIGRSSANKTNSPTMKSFGRRIVLDKNTGKEYPLKMNNKARNVKGLHIPGTNGWFGKNPSVRRKLSYSSAKHGNSSHFRRYKKFNGKWQKSLNSRYVIQEKDRPYILNKTPSSRKSSS